MSEHSFTLFADYHQFHLQDDGSEGIDGAAWDDVALQTRIALMEDAFAVSTARDMEVPVHLVVAKQTPVLDLAAWDHVVAFSIKTPSGRLAILGWVPPDAPSLFFRRCSLFSGISFPAQTG